MDVKDKQINNKEKVMSYMMAGLLLVCSFYIGSCSSNKNTEHIRNKELKAELANYRWPDGIPESEMYSVKVIYNGRAEDVHTHVSRPKPDAQSRVDRGDSFFDSSVFKGNGFLNNTELFDRTFSWVNFSFEGKVMVEVTKLYGEAASRVELSPKAYGVIPDYFDGRTVRFTLDQWKYISVNFITRDNIDDFNQIKHGMMIFADQPEVDVPAADTPITVKYSDDITLGRLARATIIYFEPGVYDLKKRFPDGIMPVETAQIVYIAGGAFVKGAFEAVGRGNVTLRGRGIISGTDYIYCDINPFINFELASNTTLEGVTITESPFHTAPVTGGNSRMKNVKIINWTFNNDGFRNGNGDVIDGVFIKTNDDHLYAFSRIEVKNSVFWPMFNGSVLTMGWAHNYRGYEGGVNFHNNYIINPEQSDYWTNRGVLMSELFPSAVQGNVRLENIYCEGDLGLLVNLHFRKDAMWDKTLGPGEIYDIVYKNIKVEKPFINTSRKQVQRQIIKGMKYIDHEGIEQIAWIRDISFINLIVGNEIITQDNYTKYFDIDPETTYNINFTTEGKIYNVNAVSSSGGNIVPAGIIPVPEGMNQTLTFIPDKGYKIRDVIVDGESLGPVLAHVIKNVAADHTIIVEYEKIQ